MGEAWGGRGEEKGKEGGGRGKRGGGRGGGRGRVGGYQYTRLFPHKVAFFHKIVISVILNAYQNLVQLILNT